MSVKIEILDYKRKIGNELEWNNEYVETDYWSNGAGITTVASNGVLITSTAGVSAQYSGFSSNTVYLDDGISYTFSFRGAYVDNAGQPNSTSLLLGTGAGNPAYRPVGNNSATVGMNSYTFTMDTSLNNGSREMKVYFQMTNGNLANKLLKIQDVQLINNSTLTAIDWEESIVGELEVTDHTDFPMAMTFQISDFKDLTSTSGDYSKTFRIPATKNNNSLLKNIFIPNVITDNKVTEKKACRILFNNLYSLVGLIQVDGLGGYGEKASYYNCVFFGSNLSWASIIQDSYMHTIEWGAEGDGLTYNKNSIMATWNDLDCNSSASYIVYPIVSYGDFNEDGNSRTIQLLDIASETDPITAGGSGYYGFTSSSVSFGTPNPVADWRPALYVKNTIDKIFGNIGYNIDSAFMETEMFKKLVWLLPNFKYSNPEKRYEDNSFICNFINVPYSYIFNVCGTSIDVTRTEDMCSMFQTGSISETNGLFGFDYYFTGGGTQFLNLEEIVTATDETGVNVIQDPSFYDDSIIPMLDFSTNEIKIREYGYYDISLRNLQGKVAFVYKGGGDNEVVDFVWCCINIELKTEGQTSWNVIEQSWNKMAIGAWVDSACWRETVYANMANVNVNRWLNKGDKIRFSKGHRITAADNTQPFILKTLIKAKDTNVFSIKFNAYHVEYGQTYNLTDVINPDYKQIDFVKGIAHAFNLKMTTEESTKTIKIEPFDSFYKPYGEAIDWTHKLDRGKEIKDKWLQSDLKRTLVFKYQSDNEDKKVERRGLDWFNDIHDEYPYREILPDTFKKGESEFVNPFFAGTFNGKNQNTTSTVGVDCPYSGILWTGVYDTVNIDRPDKGYNFMPRLLYWNKYSPATSANNNKRAVVQTWAATEQIVKADASATIGGSLISGIYPQATMLNRDNTLYNDVNGVEIGNYSPNLGYGNAWVRDYDDATGLYTSYVSGKGLYDTYYRNMMEGLKRSPRLRTLSVALKITDIVNLDFRKLIYIDGVYWRINKILDYSPSRNISTKVELIEWFELGVFTATAPMFGSSGDSEEWDGSILDNPIDDF